MLINYKSCAVYQANIPNYIFTINPTPADAVVTLTAPGYTQVGNSIMVPRGTNINYDVSKTQYIHQIDNITINSNTVLNMQMHNYLDWQPSSVDLTLGSGSFYASCYGNGKFVAINSSNEIMISTNGVNWNKAKDDNLSFRLYWYALAYGNGKFVAIDYKGYISTSTDGLHWTVATQNTQLGSLQSDNWRALAYTGSKFVLLSEDFSISTSTDGTTWTTPVSVYPGYSGYFGSLAYDGNKLIAINTSSSAWMSTSTDDGITWTTPTSSSDFNSGQGLCYGIGKYVSIDRYGISVSTDLQNWTTGIAVQPSYTLSNIVYAFGKFIIVSTNGYIYTSTDGITWTSGSNVINMPDSGWNKHVKSENKIVLVNYNNYSSVGVNHGYYATSTDNGTTWTLRESVELATVNYWDGIAYDNNNKYIVLNANGYISTSTDGITWTTPTQNANLSTMSNWHALTYYNGKFIAINWTGYISTSTDGITWSAPIQNSVLSSGHIVDVVSYRNTLYALSTSFNTSGGAWISTSTDNGTTWTTFTQVFDNSNGGWGYLVDDGTQFIAVSLNGYVSTSTNGTTWSTPIAVSNLRFDTIPNWHIIYYDGHKITGINQYGIISYIPSAIL